MRVLQVAHGFPPYSLGGVEYHVAQLVCALKELDVHCDVFCRLPDPALADYSIREERLADESVLFMVVNNGAWGGLTERSYRDSRIGGLFEDFIERRKPDLVHFHHTIALSSDLPERALRLGLPCVMTLHDYWLFCPRIQLLRPDGGVCSGPEEGLACASCVWPPAVGWPERAARKVYARIPLGARGAAKALYYRLRARRAPKNAQGAQPDSARLAFFRWRLLHMRDQFGCATWAIAPSQGLAERYASAGFDAGKLRVVPHGLAPMARRPARRRPGGKPRFCFIGSVMAHKGLHVFLDAMARIGPIAEGVIYGQRPDYEYWRWVEGRLREPTLGHVRWLGPYHPEDLPAIFAAVDALVVPSIWPEAFSLVTREAFQAGVPVIGSAIGGIAEAVLHEQNGLQVAPGDTEALAEALRRLTHDSELLARLKEGAERSEVKAMHDYAGEVAAIYRESCKVFSGAEGASSNSPALPRGPV